MRAALLLVAVTCVAACKDREPRPKAKGPPGVVRKEASGSMLPTLSPGEEFFAEQSEEAPHRGDVILMRLPDRPDDEVVKRVVGLGGDTIDLDDDGRPRIDGWAIPRCVVGKWSYQDGEQTMTGVLELEYLGDRAYLVLYDDDALGPPHGPWVVSPGEVFVLGDNRKNSRDSTTFKMGAGGGVALEGVVGVLANAAPKLPRGAPAALQEKLDACLAHRPSADPPRKK